MLNRINTLNSHLSPSPTAASSASSSSSNSSINSNDLPLPPVAQLKKGQLFPTYPEVLETSKKLGGVFTYVIGNGKRMTFVTDPAAYRHVFFARDNKDVQLDSAKLAYHWFGIDKEMSRLYTRPGLDKTREAMQYGKMKIANEDVGQTVLNKLNEWPEQGERDLWHDVAMLTFVPVVQHLFGGEAFPAAKCPAIAETLWAYDKDFRKVANGMPRSMFPKMEVLAVELADNFKRSIEHGGDISDQCPVMKARLSVLNDPEHKTWSAEKQARFMFSVFWASQGNTIPGTFWMLALIATHPEVMKKVQAEVRGSARFMKAGQGESFLAEDLPYVQACVKETLRLKVANVTLRNVINDIVVETTDGKKFHVPKGDEITVSSFVQHHDDRVYDNPYEFKPERWLEKEFNGFQWFPFGAGTNMCSGRHLAQMELGTVAALFFRDFDIEILEPLPGEAWENCVAMVGPLKRSLKFKFKRYHHE